MVPTGYDLVNQFGIILVSSSLRFVLEEEAGSQLKYTSKTGIYRNKFSKENNNGMATEKLLEFCVGVTFS